MDDFKFVRDVRVDFIASLGVNDGDPLQLHNRRRTRNNICRRSPSSVFVGRANGECELAPSPKRYRRSAPEISHCKDVLDRTAISPRDMDSSGSSCVARTESAPLALDSGVKRTEHVTLEEEHFDPFAIDNKLPPSLAGDQTTAGKTSCRAVHGASLDGADAVTVASSRSSSPRAAVTRSSSAPSELLRERVRLLQMKSHTTLLLEALLRKRSRELISLENAIIKQLPPSYAHSVPDRPIGFNAATRQVHRDADGFISTADLVVEHSVRHLISRGANPNVRDDDGNTPLLLAVQYRNGERLVSSLLKAGAEPNIMVEPADDDEYLNNESITPDDNAKASLSSSARCSSDFNAIETGSPMDIAIGLASVKIVKLLLQSGGRPTARAKVPLLRFASNYGFAAAARACLLSGLWASLEHDDVHGVHAALFNGVEIEVRDSNGRTPLYRAVESKSSNIRLIRLLLSYYHADANSLDLSSTPMIIYPIMRHSLDAVRIVELLLQHGANIHLNHGAGVETILEFAREMSAR